MKNTSLLLLSILPSTLHEEQVGPSLSLFDPSVTEGTYKLSFLSQALLTACANHVLIKFPQKTSHFSHLPPHSQAELNPSGPSYR